MKTELDSPRGYFQISESPWHSLLFLLPLITTFEVGYRVIAASDGSGAQVFAFSLLQRFFHAIGASGAMLPALAVIGILLAWHIAQKGSWAVHPSVMMCMAVESAVLAVPLIGLAVVLPHYLPLISLDRQATRLLVLSLGAGIYEELLFRLIGLTACDFLFRDLLRLPRFSATVAAVATTSATFAVYHYWGQESFAWPSMVFRTAAGIYFSVLFLTRGFGVTAGTHAAYDVAVVMLRHFARGG